jgi:hypothetical protein
MPKRKQTDTSRNKIHPSRFSRRLQEKEEEKKRMTEEVRITEVSKDLTVGEFNASYSTKRIIIIAYDHLPEFHPELYIELYSMVRNFIYLLANSSSMVEKLTFEDVPVTYLHLRKLVTYCGLSTLRLITIKRNMCRGKFSLSTAFSSRLRPDGIDVEEHLSNKWTFKLPSDSVLETIYFEQGVKKADNKDLQALNYFVKMNHHIKSIKVLNSEKHVKQLSFDSPKKDLMQATLDILLKRNLNKYHAQLKQLDSVKDSPLKASKELYVKLRAILWSKTVAKLLSDPSSFPGIFR